MSRRLYEYCRNCGEKRREFVIAYAKQFRDYLRKPDESSIHLDRRDVLTFFQRMAALYVRDALPKELLMTWTSEGTLRIIPEIIEPVEAVAIPLGFDHKPKTPSEYDTLLRNMLQLYKDIRNAEEACSGINENA